MYFTKRLAAALIVIVVVAAGCSDDGGVDQATVDSVVDDLTQDSNDTTDDPPPETEDPPPETEDPPPVVEEPPPDPAAVPEDSCVLFRHYQATGLFDAPYYTTVMVLIDLSGEEEVTVVMPDGKEYDLSVWPTDDVNGIGEIDVNFPVEGPGDVVLPEIYVDGEAIHPDLQANFWDGNDGFVAAASEIRDEEKYPAAGCTVPYMVQVDPGSLSIGDG